MEKDLIEYIAKSLVDDPSSVSVQEVEGDKSTVIELRVAPNDIGKVTISPSYDVRKKSIMLYVEPAPKSIIT